ncbi:uncharacterized protein JCM6883_001177 [Sporobolomyces salmoneus]|uniref:uncharacterized protein n=1 Tax=Sporobolomyces salmoneus TaxID=183962 RepID=UPI00317D3F10
MATRPSRTTRSSAAASSSGPVTRTTRASSTINSESNSTNRLPTRTTRSSRAGTPATDSNPPSRPVSRASANPARPSAAKPLWSSSRNNIPPNSPPSTSTAGPTVANGKRTSLAVPKARNGPGGLLRKMTSRDSIRPTATPTPQTPARSSIPVPNTPAYRESIIAAYEGPREPMKAYLRIRPPPVGASTESYMQIIGDSQVLMVPPSDHRLNPSSSSSSLFSNALLRTSNLNLNPSSHPSGTPDDLLTLPQGPDPSTFGTYYKFTSVFPSSSSSSPTSPSFPPLSEGASSQSDFFRSTTLPLVEDFLQNGENCLLFAYGPSGSGKTYTVQGGTGDDAGLLPRVMDVVWRTLKGKEPKDENPAARQVQGGPGSSTPPNGGRKPGARGLGVKESLPLNHLPDIVNVDENYEYSIWVSYSEIYNEKIYDLLESPIPGPAPSTSSISSTAASGGGMFSGFSQGAKNLFKFPTVKRSALSLKADKPTPGSSTMGQTFKVVAGMKEIRVHSAEEAQSVLSRGQANRRVFSTLANRVSSRSHSIFTIKVHRTPRDPGSGLPERTSKFSIVDLAGSERVVNTQTTGERLKEAGNINKSLMVLGQCMEVLRKNQEREKGRKPAIVPFRHSKLTEMFQSFFVGDGKAVMIVNVNPYETGYDENTHVMKFSAVAKGVMTVKKDLTHLVVPNLSRPSIIEEETQKKKSEPRVVRVSLAEGAEEEEVIYEEEDVEEDDDAEEDEFVNALLDELSTLRTALYESQMATLLAESTARARTVREYELKMLEMERKYQDRIREEAIESEMRMNAKLDILTRLQAAKTPRRGVSASLSPSSELTLSPSYDDSDEDEETEREDTRNGEDEEEETEGDSGEVEKMLLADHRDQGRDSMSPLAARVNVNVKITSPEPLAHSEVDSLDMSREEEGEEEGSEEEEDVSRDSIDSEAQSEEVNTTAEMLGSETINTETDVSVEEGTVGQLSWVTKDGEENLSQSFADTTTATEEEEGDSDEDEDDADDDDEEDYDGDEAPEADEDEQSPIRLTTQSVLQTPTPHEKEKENVVPTKMEDGPSREADEFDYNEDKSLIISSSKSGKKKRHLGAKRTFDAEAIEGAAETPVTPLRKPISSSSSRSIF